MGWRRRQVTNSGKIDRLNLSFIWTRTFFNLFEDEADQNYPQGFFARITTYKTKFQELRSLMPDHEGLSLPWERTHANKFWNYYFQGRQPLDVSHNLAWQRYLIPFRKRVDVKISTPLVMTKKAIRSITMEGFFYRHGVAVVVTLRVHDSASLDEAVKRALEARRSPLYEVKWSDGSGGSCTLGGLAKHLLDSLCEDALGPGGGMGRDFSGDPFSIAAVIQGSAEYRNRPVEEGKEIHKALEALTTWTPDWPSGNPPKLEDKRLHIKNEQDNHYLYADRGGRALWFPRLFAPSEDGTEIHALRWYSRNLVLASLQTASLGAFLAHTAERLKTGAGINYYWTSWVWNAIKAMDRLSQGDKTTYRTWSTHAQMEQNGFLDAITFLRTRL
jgi:hypothetical protein